MEGGIARTHATGKPNRKRNRAVLVSRKLNSRRRMALHDPYSLPNTKLRRSFLQRSTDPHAVFVKCKAIRRHTTFQPSTPPADISHTMPHLVLLAPSSCFQPLLLLPSVVSQPFDLPLSHADLTFDFLGGKPTHPWIVNHLSGSLIRFM